MLDEDPNMVYSKAHPRQICGNNLLPYFDRLARLRRQYTVEDDSHLVFESEAACTTVLLKDQSAARADPYCMYPRSRVTDFAVC